MTVITAGFKYIDIDAYASCIAYAILLRAQGFPAIAASTAPLNESIPSLIKEIPLSLDSYHPTNSDKFIILDVSNPSNFDTIVQHQHISQVIDHHTGFEDYWQQKLLENQIDSVEIEFIGSICTVIYEKFVQANKTHVLDSNICKLLTAGILDNTLNLKATITTDRDRTAYAELLRLGGLDQSWAETYLSACQDSILSDLSKAIINDIKGANDNKNLPNTIGQLVLFDGQKVVQQLEVIKQTLSHLDEWMLNIISLNDGKSFIVATSAKTKQDLEKLFNTPFNNDILTLDPFMLRKEIIKKAQEQ